MSTQVRQRKWGPPFFDCGDDLMVKSLCFVIHCVILQFALHILCPQCLCERKNTIIYDFAHASVYTYGFILNNNGLFLHVFECQVVCWCVIYVCVCAYVCSALAVTSGTSVIGVVSPQAFSLVIDDTYHNLSAGTQTAN